MPLNRSLPGAYLSNNPVTSTDGDTETLAEWVQTVADQREILTGTRTYWVANTGNDNNNGLSFATAFATMQKAIDVIWETLDTAGYQVVIAMAGTQSFTAGCVATGPVPGGGTVLISGNTVTPSNIVFTATSSNVFTAQYGAALQIQGVEMRTTTSGNCIQAQFGGNIYYTNVIFGTCAGAQVEAKGGGQTLAGSAYTISGSAVSHLHASYDSSIIISGTTITILNTPAFSAYFAGIGGEGFIQAIGATYVGAATGTKAFIHYNGSLRTDTNNRNALPGNLPMIIMKGGVYDFIRKMTISLTGTTSLVLNDDDRIYLCDATAGSFSINLPSAATADGVEYTFKKTTAANTVTIDGDGGETIDGAATLAMTTQWTAVTIHCDGTQWYVL